MKLCVLRISFHSYYHFFVNVSCMRVREKDIQVFLCTAEIEIKETNALSKFSSFNLGVEVG